MVGAAICEDGRLVGVEKPRIRRKIGYDWLVPRGEFHQLGARSAPAADSECLLAFLRAATVFAALRICTALGVSGAAAVEAVNIRVDASAIDLTDAVEIQRTDTDRIQVSTTPGADGIVRRIEVRGREAGNDWAVFALANNGEEQIDRLIVAPHYRMVGSGLLWPDLGMSRIAYITPSSGDPPERIENPTADVFRVTLDPGTVITFVAELRGSNLPQLYLWEPDAFKDKVNSLTLYQGIVIGIAGLLALFLTILFVVKGSVMFPAAAALGWAVLIYIGVDFGFWGKVFDMSSGAERIWRASGEAILVATLLVFLFAYLNLNRWHVRYAHITVGWLAFLGALVAVALYSPADCFRHRTHLVVLHRRAWLRAGALSVDPWLRPRRDADPDLAVFWSPGSLAPRLQCWASSPTTSSDRRCSAASSSSSC